MTSTIDHTTRGHQIAESLGITVKNGRAESLSRAESLGTDTETLRVIANTLRVGRGEVVPIPSGRYEHLSRGRGWCRRNDGTFCNERDADACYLVGPGRWTVGSKDGYSRQDRVEWVVRAVKVGSVTWTVAE